MHQHKLSESIDIILNCIIKMSVSNIMTLEVMLLTGIWLTCLRSIIKVFFKSHSSHFLQFDIINRTWVRWNVCPFTESEALGCMVSINSYIFNSGSTVSMVNSCFVVIVLNRKCYLRGSHSDFINNLSTVISRFNIT